MYRKIGLVVCAWVLAWTLGGGAFADTTPKMNMASAIEILDPVVGSEGDVILNKEALRVTVRTTGTAPAYLSLYRIDPELYLGSETKSDVTFIPNDDFDKLTDEQKDKYRRDVLAKKTRLEAAYEASRTEYNAVLAVVKKDFGDAAKMEALRANGVMSPAQIAVSDRYRKANADVMQKKKDYLGVKTLYDKLFTRLVYGPVPVKADAVLKKFDTEIPGVKAGVYVLAFSEKADGTGIFKTLEFKVGTSEAAVEKMLESLPESRSIIK